MEPIPEDLFFDEEPQQVEHFLRTEAPGYTLLSEKMVRGLIRPRDAFAYKHRFGHTLVIAGSEGKGGAAILASRAALHSGCGLVTALVPRLVQQALLVALPEAMSIVRDERENLLPDLSLFQSVGFGPGVGMQAGTMLKELLGYHGTPLVIDADGLTLLSQDKSLYSKLHRNVVLTPHAGEFDRLTQSHTSHLERVKTQLAFARRYNVVVLLKGRYTAVATPEGDLYFNTSGNSGMATAGSGDVLTGIIASLAAQGYTAERAALVGAFLHGAAGDIAAVKHSMESMLASDIIDAIGQWFAKVR